MEDIRNISEKLTTKKIKLNSYKVDIKSLGADELLQLENIIDNLNSNKSNLSNQEILDLQKDIIENY